MLLETIDYRLSTNKCPLGFTLIEIMIVVIIIGLLAVIALPNLSRARQTAQQTACYNNMRQIDAAKNRWALEGGKTGADTPTEEELDVYIRYGFPTCPGQGTYVIGNADTPPSCTIHGEF